LRRLSAFNLSSVASSVVTLYDIASSDGLFYIDSVADAADNEADTTGDKDAPGVTAITVEEREVMLDGLVDADVVSEHGSLFNSSLSKAWF
jgi:hypothetical protein